MEKKSIASNYIYNLIYQIILAVIPLVTTPYLTRVLGAENLGIYSYTYSIATIFFLLSALGINTYGQREIAYVQDSPEKYSKVFWELVIVRCGATVISATALIALSLIVNEYTVCYQIFAIYIIANAFDITWFYQGIENFKAITVRNIIIKIIYLGLVFLFVKDRSDLHTYILLFSAMTLATNLSFWIKTRKILTKPKNLEVKKHIKPVVVLFLPQIASLIYTVLDKTMLGIICPQIEQVSFYEQASYIVKTILMLVTTIGTVMVSKVSYAFQKQNMEEVKNYLNQVTNFVWLASSALMFGVAAAIENFVKWFYAEEYISVANIVYVMCPIIIFIGLNNIIGIQFLVPTKNQNKYIFAVVIGAVANFVMNLILIKPLGPIGATIASVMAELVIVVVELAFLKKIIPDYKIAKNAFKYLALGFVMFGVVKVSGNFYAGTVYSTAIQVVAGVITYGVLLIVTKDKFVMGFLTKFWRKEK